MKKILFLIFIFSFPLFSAHSEDGNSIIQLKDRMHRLQMLYLDLEKSLLQKPPDYFYLQETLKKMEGNLKMIRKINSSSEMDRSFKQLERDIRDFKGVAKRQNLMGVENSMNSLFENCFRCHLTHSPARESKNKP